MTPRVLSLLPGTFSICRLHQDQAVPAWAQAPADFWSITRTHEELSIICLDQQMPPTVPADRGWRCLRIEGPFDLTEPGVLAGVVGPLAVGNISVFAVATHDTDYLLVRDLTGAAAALARAGHRLTGLDGGGDA